MKLHGLGSRFWQLYRLVEFRSLGMTNFKTDNSLGN